MFFLLDGVNILFVFHLEPQRYICDAGEADGGTRLTSFDTKITSLHDLEAGQLYSHR